MNIKELLLEGCTISFPHKADINDWVGDVKITIYGGYFCKPKIMIDGYRGGEEWDFTDANLDIAIARYTEIVFNKENLYYKMPVITRELNQKGEYHDLDSESDYLKVRTLINQRIDYNQ